MPNPITLFAGSVCGEAWSAVTHVEHESRYTLVVFAMPSESNIFDIDVQLERDGQIVSHHVAERAIDDANTPIMMSVESVLSPGIYRVHVLSGQCPVTVSVSCQPTES